MQKNSHFPSITGEDIAHHARKAVDRFRGNGAAGIDNEGNEMDSGATGRKIEEEDARRAKRTADILGKGNAAAGIGKDGKELDAGDPGAQLAAARARDKVAVLRAGGETGADGRAGAGSDARFSGRRGLKKKSKIGLRQLQQRAKSFDRDVQSRANSGQLPINNKKKTDSERANANSDRTGEKRSIRQRLSSTVNKVGAAKRKLKEKFNLGARGRAFLDRKTAAAMVTLAGIPIALIIIFIRALASFPGAKDLPIIGSLRYTETDWRKALKPNFEKLIPFTLTPKMAWALLISMGMSFVVNVLLITSPIWISFLVYLQVLDGLKNIADAVNIFS